MRYKHDKGMKKILCFVHFSKNIIVVPKTQQTQQKQHLRLVGTELTELVQNQGYVFAYKAHSGALPASYIH